MNIDIQDRTSTIGHAALRAMIRDILQRGVTGWTIQGFGMLRLRLDGGWRLHLWHSEFAVPDVSVIHDHPWDFTSYVVAGAVTNRTFDTLPAGTFGLGGVLHHRQTLRCGEGGCLLGEPEQVLLRERPVQHVRDGMSYTQRAQDVHASVPMDGTVTLVRRTVPEGCDPDTAHVFWPLGRRWGSAEPREATAAEVKAFTDAALALLTEQQR